MRAALGSRGAQWIKAGIAISTLGFLSQSMLTGPRVYYAMARDGLFFASVGKLSQRSRAPVVAIMLQGLAAIVIACSGTYGQILNFEVTVDFIFFAMTAASLLFCAGVILDRTQLLIVCPVIRSRRFFLFYPVLELSEALSSLRRRIAQSRWVSCWPRCRFTIIGGSSDEQIHDTQKFGLHALVQDAKPRAIQSRNEWRSALATANCQLVEHSKSTAATTGMAIRLYKNPSPRITALTPTALWNLRAPPWQIILPWLRFSNRAMKS